jgi:soluble epoxide hydrolase / lipid-phosphate phosphatase
MDKLDKKTLKVSRGYNYTYYTSHARDGKPTVLLVHGWPDSAELWNGVVSDYLVPQGYGVVAIDCLGYAGTSKPADPKEYNIIGMTKDIADILDNEGIDKVVSLGHDWGCYLSQRVYNYYPDRVLGLVLMNVSYLPPSQPFDLDAVIEATEKAFGHGNYWYWKLFAADDGPGIMATNKEAVWDVAHGKLQAQYISFKS